MQTAARLACYKVHTTAIVHSYKVLAANLRSITSQSYAMQELFILQVLLYILQESLYM